MLVRCHQPSKPPPLLYFHSVFNSPTNLLHKNGDGEGLTVTSAGGTGRSICSPSAQSLQRVGRGQLWGHRSQHASSTHRVTGAGLGDDCAQMQTQRPEGEAPRTQTFPRSPLGRTLVTVGCRAKPVLSSCGCPRGGQAWPSPCPPHLSGAVSGCSKNPKPLGEVGGCHLLQSLFQNMCPRPEATPGRRCRFAFIGQQFGTLVQVSKGTAVRLQVGCETWGDPLLSRSVNCQQLAHRPSSQALFSLIHQVM